MHEKAKNWCWWLVALVLFTGAISARIFLVQYSAAWKNIGLLTAVGLAFVCFSRTTLGIKFIQFWKASVLEVRKSVWPTRQETMQTTIAVLAMIVVMGLLLWTIDLGLLKLVATLTGRWGN
jgi:preprotein translocase subunit SecE